MTNKYPLITVGISCHNAKNYILDAIKSVYAQTYQNWELIIIDDGSTDKTWELIKSIREERIRVYRYEESKGLAFRLNQISKLARGEYIARMDADDIMHPERLNKQISYFLNNNDADCIDTAAAVIDLDGNIVGIKGRLEEPASLFRIFKDGYFLHASIMAKRNWFLNNPYDENFIRAEDRELWVRVYRHTRFKRINDVLYFYRFANNVRFSAFLKSYETERKIILKYGPRELGIFSSYALYMRSILKTLILRILYAFGYEQIILRNKYERISDQEKFKYQIILNQIRSIKI